ncbi:multi-sensor signal transduction histidine kinase [Desulfitobacterium hafniense DCB-2]|uniref:histidine kinase n=1 Tax=Desulfitobacterium hafniense (strain DSM 10664 / DCB-2) TaxID=272564 RepID=B8G147_DESHD|nr:PAS domain S-box protein [Desulfitobacterium hafniense]ACL19262.1 multi-sensor signal transduction histidine kinase [Desulfitobacterium hafniense DCB-2]
MKLSTKMIIITVILIVVMGLLTMGAISTIVEQAMTQQLEEQGLTYSRMAADNVANPLLDGNVLIVQRTIENLLQTGSGISYVYVIDNYGNVIAHTFSGGFPSNLTNINILGSNQMKNTILLNMQSQGLIRDVGVRILEGLNAEIHIGFSQNSILQWVYNVRKLMLNLTLYGVLLGAVAALILSTLITRPLKRLASYALRLGKGDLEEDIVIRGKDEIVELALCLNRMRKDLFTGMQMLRQSEESNRTLLEAISAAGEGIAVFQDNLNKKGTMKFVNEQYENLTGYTKAELLEMEANEIIDSESGKQIEEVWERSKHGLNLPKQIEILFNRKDGTKLYMEASYCNITYEGNPAIISITRDITEKKKTSMEIIRKNRELAALNELSKAISGHMNLKDKLYEALNTILQVVGKQAGWIFLYNERDNDNKAELMCQIGILPEEALTQTKQFQSCSNFPKPNSNSIQVHSSLSTACSIKQLYLPDGTKALSHVYVPLSYKDRVLGVLNIIASNLESFTKEDLNLLNSIGLQLGVAIENAELWVELNKKEMLRKQLLNKVITAQEEERKRISRELHDESSQSIAALGVGLKSVIEIMEFDKEYALTVLEDLKNNTSSILKELHQIIYDLRPSLLDDLGLLPAIRWYVESRLSNTGIKPHVAFTGDPLRLTDETEITIFRIVQESITNAVKYSNAKNLYLGLEFGQDSLFVYIEDDGDGFNIEKALAQKDGKESFGLLGMTERAELIGGEIEIKSRSNNGTRIELKLDYQNFEEDRYEENQGLSGR